MADQGAADDKPTVGGVEVLKDEHTRMWYSAHVLDMVGKDKILIGFHDDVWPKQEFPYSRVRKPTKQSQAETDSFNPRIGDEVELRCNATDHQPAAWGAAVVKNIKHSFYFVTRVSNTGADGQAEAIVEKSMLRPSLGGTRLDNNLGAMKQDHIKIVPGLRDWIASDDAIGCLTRIEADAGLMFIKVGRNDITLVGDEKATQRAKMLFDVHQKHQVQIQNFQDVREKRLSALEKRRNRIEGTGYKHSIEIQIDPSFVRRVIGTKGENIRAVMQKYEVNIHVPDEDETSSTRTVKIFGNSMENIEKARGEVEFIEEVYPEVIDPTMFTWIKGRGDKTIKLFKEITGIVYTRLDRESRQMIVCGTRNAVEEAMAMFETHLMYYPVFSQMDEEMEQLLNQLEEYGDYGARRDFGWYRDDDDNSYNNNNNNDGYYNGGKSSGSKGKSKGGKSNDKGGDWRDSRDDWNQRSNDWDDNWRQNDRQDDWKSNGKSQSKGGKSKGGKGKAQAWDEDDDEEDHKVATRPPLRGKGGGKDGNKASGKGSGNARSGERDEAWEEEPEPQPRARGRGKGAGGRGPMEPRGADQEDDDPPPPPPALPSVKPAANRRMGKKGIRSSES